MKDKKLPTKCPSCENELTVIALYCDNCKTKIEGHFTIPPLVRINQDDQFFILDFVKNSGSLKNMEKSLNLSYPTIRNKLNEIINKIS